MSFRRDWKCKNCGAVSRDVPTWIKEQWCPFCGTPMEKVWEPAVVLFKGNGWTPKFNGVSKED